MKPIDDWRTVAWRSATTWVTAAVHFVFAVIGTHWAVLLGVLPFIPAELRLLLALLVAVLTVLPTIAARVWKQPKLRAKLEEKRDGVVEQ